MAAPIVIVGTGLAGYSAARGLRRLDPAVPLVMVSEDGGEFYSKPTLSEALTAGKTPATIPNNTAEQMAVQLKAVVRPRTVVTAIEPAAKRVKIDDEALAYSKLVLAVGAQQIRVPIAGDAADEVLTVNSLDDYARFRAALAGKQAVAIIGAGLIGCEFANDLSSAGYRVALIDIARQPLSRLLPAEAAALLMERLAASGVAWHLDTGVRSVDREGGALAIALTNGESLRADLILSAVGLTPRLGLAQAAGLRVNRGIVVDRLLCTSIPDIHALGDCAEVAGHVLPFVMPISHAARALAATLSGSATEVTYPAMPVVVKTPAWPTVVCPPPAGAAGEWRVTREPDGVKSLFVGAGEKLLGFALSGKATAERTKLAQQLAPVLA